MGRLPPWVSGLMGQHNQDPGGLMALPLTSPMILSLCPLLPTSLS